MSRQMKHCVVEELWEKLTYKKKNALVLGSLCEQLADGGGKTTKDKGSESRPHCVNLLLFFSVPLTVV